MHTAGDYLEYATLVRREMRKQSNRSVAIWHCRCDCGEMFEKAERHFRPGKPFSCGCKHRFPFGNGGTGNAYHPLYGTWCRLIERCVSPKSTGYPRYGARGIGVCDRWRWGEAGLSGFDAFVADMGEKPSPRHTVERTDNSAGYSPENCVWATATEQSRNRRSVGQYTYNGKTQTLPEWAAEVGRGRATLARRIKAGWPLEQVFTSALRPWRMPNRVS